MTDKLDSGHLVGSLLILDCKNVPKRALWVPAKVSPFRKPWIQIGSWTLGRFFINFKLQKCSEKDFFGPGVGHTFSKTLDPNWILDPWSVLY